MPNLEVDGNNIPPLQYLKEDGSAYEQVKGENNAFNVNILSFESGIETEVKGDVAHDSADSGNPVKIGGKGNAAKPGAVTESDRVNASFDLYGSQRVILPDSEGTADAAAPANVIMAGAVANATADTPDEGDASRLSVDLNSRLRVLQDGVVAAPDAAAPGLAEQIGGVGNATANALDEGDLGALSLNLGSELRVTNEKCEAAHDAAAPSNVKMAGAVANATADTPDEGDACRLSVDLNSRLRVIHDGVVGASDAAAPTLTQQVGALANASAPSPDEGDMQALSMTLSGETRVILESASGASDAAAPTNTLQVGAKANAANPTPDENDLQHLSCDLEANLRVAQAGKEIVLTASSEKTSSANGTAVANLGGFGYAEVLFDMEAADTAAGDTLDVYVDASPDGGTTWVNVVHFNQVIGTDAAGKYTAIVNTKGATGTAVGTVTGDLTTAPDIRHYLGNAMRARWVIVNVTDPKFTFSVKANMKT